ncbi:hypothetical protein B0T44_03985 [Nocardia donostiensis]|uniref:DUF3558 domain-containing protein n=2 Tax=Nocardia donostiensis TaxID=1538463 RepID=A0A1W0BKE9_9NOCA|nr:hypothetical protein B0T46_10480 [Nocardia donostiensis]OQS22963.1 hypothetical protein B0T44_03985 [Nocardia donostiensis]
MLVLAGCGETSGDSGKRNRGADVQHNGSAATTTAQQAALWDPCALPETATDKTGLDASSKKTGIAGVDFTEAGWKVCSWRSEARWYTLAIMSGAPTLDEVKNRPDFTGFAPRSIDSREAVQYKSVGDTDGHKCGIAVELSQGVVLFDVQVRYSVGRQGDPCAEAERHASDLASYLPKS